MPHHFDRIGTRRGSDGVHWCRSVAGTPGLRVARQDVLMLRWRRRLAAALVATALTLPVVAHAQYFGQNKIQYQKREWKSITSDHFEVYFYSGLDSLAMRVLDLAEKTDIVLSQRMGHSL